MKRKLCFSILLLSLSVVVVAQSKIPISLNLNGGYTFDDRFDLGVYNNYSNYGRINGSGQYGVGIEAFLQETRSLELTYQYMGTHAPFYAFNGQTNAGDDKATLNFILIGGNNYLPTRSNILPYAGMGIGVGIVNFDYDGKNRQTLTKFAWNLHLGAKIKTESAVSFKIQAYLQSIVNGIGVGVGFGTGGAGAGVTTYSSILQFGVGGVVCFALGKQ